ncbi:hypothetical protein KC364_g69 [Hortaea werneckii]|nr:hypothetical protein KC364_g69 [Hortaea werneckii]
MYLLRGPWNAVAHKNPLARLRSSRASSILSISTHSSAGEISKRSTPPSDRQGGEGLSNIGVGLNAPCPLLYH